MLDLSSRMPVLENIGWRLSDISYMSQFKHDLLHTTKPLARKSLHTNYHNNEICSLRQRVMTLKTCCQFCPSSCLFSFLVTFVWHDGTLIRSFHRPIRHCLPGRWSRCKSFGTTMTMMMHLSCFPFEKSMLLENLYRDLCNFYYHCNIDHFCL